MIRHSGRFFQAQQHLQANQIALCVFVAVASIFLILSIIASSTAVLAVETKGANTTSAIFSSKQYIENTKRLLQQVSLEYKDGNHTAAEELATTAYLDNFEFVEIDLVKHNAKALSDQIEQMMRVQLREMIKTQVSQDKIDSQIKAIDSKLDEALIKVG
jgi:hypothetical protein